MNTIEIKSYAKINLCLNILKRLPNNYHEISSLMQKIDLFDEIKVSKKENSLDVKTDIDKLNSEIKYNTAYLASRYFFDYTKIKSGADIYIKKNVPHQAGLGGSSANAAAVIDALDVLYETNLKYDEKFKLGLKVGCDVPFFFGSGTAVVEGIGDKIIQKNQLNGYYLIIIKPDFGICTKTAYASINPLKLENKCSSEELYSAYLEHNKEKIKQYTINTFEDVIDQKAQIISIKKDILDCGAITALMTGSGSAVFGLFENDYECTLTFNTLKNKHRNIFKCKFF